MSQTATVVGSGIAGLASAIALAESGWKVAILERREAPASWPVGIVITQNGMQALAALGLERAVARAGLQTRMGAVLSEAGTQLLAPTTTGAGALTTIHYDTLRELLAERAEKLGVTTTYDTLIRSDADLPASDLVIGADGIRSVVRGWLKPRVKPDYSGSTCWHGVVARDASTPTQLTTWVGRGVEAGIVPIDGDCAYWYISKTARLGGAGDAAEQAAEESAAIEGPVTEHVLATDPGDVRRHDLWYLPTALPRFTSVRTGTPTMLVGDAAHAMVPSLVQGANQAFEDAATLRVLLEMDLETDALFARFNEERVERTQKLQQRSLDAMRVMQSNNPITGAARNFALKAVPTLLAELALDWHGRWWNPSRRR